MNDSDLKNKICLISGGNSGVGKAMATGLARSGATVIILCRNKEKAEQTTDEIIYKTKNGNIDYMLADLSVQNSIRQLAETFKSKYADLHVLSNNAGILSMKRKLTADGIESTFAVDYLSHFLLTNLLLDLLKSSRPSRIITVAGGPSILKKTKINFDDIQFENKYNGIKAAVQAALARTIWTYELAKRLSGTSVTANSFHPGLVQSNLTRNIPLIGRPLSKLSRYFLNSECKTGIYLAVSPEVENITGRYFVSKKPIDFLPDDDLHSNAERLWEISESLTSKKSHYHEK